MIKYLFLVVTLITAHDALAGKNTEKLKKRLAQQQAATLAYYAKLQKEKEDARIQLELHAAMQGQTVMHCTQCGHDVLAPHLCCIFLIGTAQSSGAYHRQII